MSRIEDLYETSPIEIELVGGGGFDGRRMLVPEDRDELLMPIPVSVGLFDLFDPEPDVTRTFLNVQRYRYAGIGDDGVRMFRAT